MQSGGGVPRAVLEKADLECYQCIDMEGAVTSHRLSNILATVGTVAAADDSSSKILHFDVDPDNIRIKVVFASQWVADTLVSRAWQQAEADVRYFLSVREHDPRAAGMRGQVFKSFAHKQLQRGGTFTVRDLSDDSHAAAEVETWPAMRYQEFSKVTEVSDCPAALYMMPQARNSKAFDAVCPPRDALQMTVSPRHPISHIGEHLCFLGGSFAGCICMDKGAICIDVTWGNQPFQEAPCILPCPCLYVPHMPVLSAALAAVLA